MHNFNTVIFMYNTDYYNYITHNKLFINYGKGIGY